jgi:hypothetical protein
MKRKELVILSGLLFAGLLIAGCGGGKVPLADKASGFDSTPEINQQAADEARKAVDEAEKAFKDADAQVNAIFAIPASGDRLAFVKSKKSLFESAGDQYRVARDKFELAATKYDEAMNGKKYWDSGLHCMFKLLGEAYREWAELADTQIRLCQEAINIKDVKSFAGRTSELETESKRLNGIVDQKIKSARSCRSADVKK